MQSEVISYKILADRLLSLTTDHYEKLYDELMATRAKMIQLLQLNYDAPEDAGVSRETLDQWMEEALAAHRSRAH